MRLGEQCTKQRNIMDYQAAIIEAIKELNDVNGSSMPFIRKIVQKKLPEGCEWDNAAFLLALKKGVKTGLFVQSLPQQASSGQKLPEATTCKEQAPVATLDDKVAAGNLRALRDGTKTEDPLHAVPQLLPPDFPCMNAALHTGSQTAKFSDKNLTNPGLTSTSTNADRPLTNNSNKPWQCKKEDNPEVDHLVKVRARKRQISVKLQLTCLLHAVVCSNPKCQWEKCSHLKKYLRHCHQCQVKAIGGCLSCKYIGTILIAHARQCRANCCPVPNCRRIRLCLKNCPESKVGGKVGRANA